MNHPEDPVTRYYLDHLDGDWQDRGVYSAECPFCSQRPNNTGVGRIIVLLKPEGFFHGYFRCQSRCVPGGFIHWFAQLLNHDPAKVPGYQPEDVTFRQQQDYPVTNHNDEMIAFHDRLPEDLRSRFHMMQVSDDLLADLKIGFNGRYLTYPYIQPDGKCYALRCVFPDRPDDSFWHGDERFSQPPHTIFNVQELERCRGGTVFLTDSEDSLLILKQLGYPAVAVPHYQQFEQLQPELFHHIHTVFVLTANAVEAEMEAQSFASLTGFKVRLLHWPADIKRNADLAEVAETLGSKVRQLIASMVRDSTAYSPFNSPDLEYSRFLSMLQARNEGRYNALQTGFPLLDQHLEGVHGINVIGGAPKVGKSTFAIQIASRMAAESVPVLYYDFENGRQQVYQRIVSRLARLEVQRLDSPDLNEQERASSAEGVRKFKALLPYLRVINDRQLTPDLMKKQIEFIKHEMRCDYAVVIIDSLHKLPFKDLSERRTGIDGWLRQFEAMRDELQASFIILSELSRGSDQPYSEKPHLGIFKGSGDIEYSADNAMVLYAEEHQNSSEQVDNRCAKLWMVASRERKPGAIGSYRLDYPFWGFVEEQEVSS